MSALLQIPATLHDGAGGTLFEGSFDACLDAWLAMAHDERAGALIDTDGAAPDFSPDITFPLDAAGIAKAVLMRENMEWP